MKKIGLFIVSLLGILYVEAQSPKTMEKIEAARIALITERLELTPEQAEKFWPIYREFSDKRRQLREEFRQLRQAHNPQTATEEENRQMLDKGLKIKERQLELDKAYTERFQRVITSRQLMSLRKAEDDFREMLMRRIRQQQRQHDQIRDERLRNSDKLQKRKTD